MYLVKIKYNYKYIAYERENIMACEDLYIVYAKNQYESIEKVKRFIVDKHVATVEFTAVTSNAPETGDYGLMIDGIIQ
jgi:hypothetical protein